MGLGGFLAGKRADLLDLREDEGLRLANDRQAGQQEKAEDGLAHGVKSVGLFQRTAAGGEREVSAGAVGAAYFARGALRVCLPSNAPLTLARMSQPRIVVKVFLYQITPQIWRRFSVPASFSFLQLNDAIQDAMGWENKHPHEFRHGKGKRLTDVIGPVGLADQVPKGGEFQDELKLTLADFIGKKRLPMRMLYRYDFAEDWLHEVVLEKKEDGDEEGAVMIDGARACPPEDFGGAFQYMEALTGQIGWYRGEYDPEAFDIKEVVFGGKKRNPKKRKLL